MSTAREKTFLCTFKSRSKALSMRILAWNEREAAQIFREELEERGVGGRGEIEVTSVVRAVSVWTEPLRHAS